MEHGLTPFQSKVLSDLSAIREDMNVRLAVLEMHDHECHGNGQPGWKKEHGRRISRLEKWVAGCSGGGVAVGWLLKLVTELR